MPNSPEKYLSLKVHTNVAKKEFLDDSELMEDLYKILPLTLETLSDSDKNTINCQFDTLSDLSMAENILTLVFSAPDLTSPTNDSNSHARPSASSGSFFH